MDIFDKWTELLNFKGLFLFVDHLSLIPIVMKQTSANEEHTYVAPEIEELKIDVQSSVIMDSCSNYNEEPGEIFD